MKLVDIHTYIFTSWKVSKYWGFPGPYFPPEETPDLDTFHAVHSFLDNHS